MARGFYNFILRLVERIESLLIKGVIALIILLITVQISLQEPLNSEFDLRELEVLNRARDISFVNRALNYLPLQLAEEITEEVEAELASQAVLSPAEERGMIELKILNLPEARELRLFVNDEFRGNFSNNFLQVAVEFGDELILDGRGIEQGIWVEIADASHEISSYIVGKQFWIKDEVKSLQQIEFGERY